MDGVDTTWGRVPGGAEVAKLADQAVAKFDRKNPAASVPPCWRSASRVAALPSDPVVLEKRRQLDRAIHGCLGLVVETTGPGAEVVPGEVLHLRHSATVAANVPVRWLSVPTPYGPGVGEPIGLTTVARYPRAERRCRPTPTQPSLLAADEHTSACSGLTQHADRPPGESPAFPSSTGSRSAARPLSRPTCSCGSRRAASPAGLG